MEKDSLKDMFELREEFMRAITEIKPPGYPEWPVDTSEKKSQQVIREISLKGVEEVFEALTLLRNWKSHKDNGSKEFDREHFIEEFVDAFNYFIAVLVLLGVDADEFIEAYRNKNKIIHDRLRNGY